MAKGKKGKGAVVDDAAPPDPVEASADSAPQAAPQQAAEASPTPQWITLAADVNVGVGGQVIQLRKGRNWVEPHVLSALRDAGVQLN